MSSFLAPIHFWLYNKIQIQEALINSIAQMAEDKGFLCGTGSYSGEPLPDLRAAIDLGNIHGWLQDKICSSEQRLAGLVTEILSDDESRLGTILARAEAFGKNYAIPQGSGAQEAYTVIGDTLLNGMPCDRVEEVVINTPELVVWKNITDLHAPYWEEIKGKAAHYWDIRAAIIRGLLSETDLSFGEDSMTFEIKQ
ncbi:MAG: hypothetical protein ACTTH7_00420 [Treponema sp.]